MKNVLLALLIVFAGVSLLTITPSLTANNPILSSFFKFNLFLLGISIIGIGLLTVVWVSDHPQAVRQRQILNNFVTNNKILNGIQDSFLLLLFVGTLLIVVDIVMTVQATSVFGLLMERNVHVRYLLSSGRTTLWFVESITPLLLVGIIFYLIRGTGLISKLVKTTLSFYLIASIIMTQIVLLNNTLVFLSLGG
ncbi:MAG: hypothetical protein IH932_03285 [Thaumarchaeota archaeon]|nr:hypothetical protein [Nitrososphaerota archaeon]